MVKRDVFLGGRLVSVDVMWAQFGAELTGGVAQMVERSLSMREAGGSIPPISTFSPEQREQNDDPEPRGDELMPTMNNLS